jgi:hypothetical protein
MKCVERRIEESKNIQEQAARERCAREPSGQMCYVFYKLGNKQERPPVNVNQDDPKRVEECWREGKK